MKEVKEAQAIAEKVKLLKEAWPDISTWHPPPEDAPSKFQKLSDKPKSRADIPPELLDIVKEVPAEEPPDVGSLGTTMKIMEPTAGRWTPEVTIPYLNPDGTIDQEKLAAYAAASEEKKAQKLDRVGAQKETDWSMYGKEATAEKKADPSMPQYWEVARLPSNKEMFKAFKSGIPGTDEF